MTTLSSRDGNGGRWQQSDVVEYESGYAYRDLNHNGTLDIYEDPRRPVEARVEDLLGQMTPEEKAGTLFIQGVVVNPDGSLESDPKAPGHGRVAASLLADQKLTHFNVWQVPGVQALATWHNALQRRAEASRLGIPVTIASDPRHHFSHNIFSLTASHFSQWCETLGFGAIGDPELVRQFADIAREEYLAAGIRLALHPQIDLATQPRWPRISGTFGEDAHVSARLGQAYIEGFQGKQLGPHSVACMTKHFPGGGPQDEGLDPHFDFHKGQVYPGGNFAYHLIPFEAAIAAGPAAMMPYYGVPVGQTGEDVAMAFNREVITGLLRERYGYDGVICTDWGVITDGRMGDAIWPARAWGVEHLDGAGRVEKALAAGVDQFGGENRTDLVVVLLESGRISPERIDASVRRVLRLKFTLGLFDNPFVDEGRVTEVMGRAASIAAGAASQRRAMSLLKNENQVLPLSGRPRLYVKNLDAGVAARYGEMVSEPADAGLAILRLQAPWYPIDSPNPFARGFHHGDLDFKGDTLAEILKLLRAVPTIVVMYLDRPAVIPEIAAAARGLLVDYGASDEAVLDVIFGRARPEGKLPFELPCSMEAVRSQKADVPHDSVAPLFPFGYGLGY